MSRNSTGTYTLPSGNPVVAGTTIEASWANTTLDDIATALTGSLSRSGEGAMLAALRIVDGTIGAPGMAFATETGSGFYRSGTNTFRVTINGSDTFEFNASGVSVPSGKSLTVAGTFALTGDQVQVSEGGTGSNTAAGARVNLLPSYTANALKVLRVNADSTDVEWTTDGGGDVVGPSSSTNNAIALFDGTTGKLIKNSSSTLPTGSIVGTTDTQTLTNKRINPRVVSTASASSLTPDVSSADQYAYTALAANLAINAPTGTPVDGNKLLFRILDNGVSRTLTWDATYTAIGVTLPTATTVSKTTYVGCVYNANATRWDVVAVTTQA